jgi:hypothetical protein
MDYGRFAFSRARTQSARGIRPGRHRGGSERRTQIPQISQISQKEQVVLFCVNLRNRRNLCSPFFAARRSCQLNSIRIPGTPEPRGVPGGGFTQRKEAVPGAMGSRCHRFSPRRARSARPRPSASGLHEGSANDDAGAAAAEHAVPCRARPFVARPLSTRVPRGPGVFPPPVDPAGYRRGACTRAP